MPKVCPNCSAAALPALESAALPKLLELLLAESLPELSSAELLSPVADAPPKPEYTVPPLESVVAPASLAVRLALEDMVLLMVEELGLMGSWAPQGWSCRQEDEQALSPLQPVTHWLPHSWQMKKGIVWVYWVTLGLRPSPHSQENWRVSESQVLSFVVKVSEGGCRQISCEGGLLEGRCGEYVWEYSYLQDIVWSGCCTRLSW